MTYMKPELVELVSAAHIIQSGDTGDTSNSKGSVLAEDPVIGGDQSKSTTAAAYEADE